MEIRHNEGDCRFEYRDGSAMAVCEYQRLGLVWDLNHTYVPDSLRGQGIAAALARTALDHIREQGGVVRASCSYIATFIAKNPAYAQLLEKR